MLWVACYLVWDGWEAVMPPLMSSGLDSRMRLVPRHLLASFCKGTPKWLSFHSRSLCSFLVKHWARYILDLYLLTKLHVPMLRLTRMEAGSPSVSQPIPTSPPKWGLFVPLIPIVQSATNDWLPGWLCSGPSATWEAGRGTKLASW